MVRRKRKKKETRRITIRYGIALVKFRVMAREWAGQEMILGQPRIGSWLY